MDLHKQAPLPIKNYSQYLDEGNPLSRLIVHACRYGYGGLNGNYTTMTLLEEDASYRIWVLHLEDLEFRFFDTEEQIKAYKALTGR